MNNDYRFENRKFVILAIVVGIVLLFICRLFYLQILNDDYKKYADSNAFLNKTVYPSRGVMYDRNGKLLVSNQPAYDVMVCMRNVKELDTLAFCGALGITREFFDKRIKDIKREQAEAEKKAQQVEAEQSAEPATEEQKSVVSYNLTSSESEAEAKNTEQSNE